jgi:arsenate reductase
MTNPKEKPKILFVCMANATRSQMAEGWARHLAPEVWDVYSAGLHPVGQLSSRTVKAMAEAGVDISRQWSKGIDAWPGITFDYVVILDDSVKKACPDFPEGTQVIHKHFPDPTCILGTDDQVMIAFEKVRGMIKAFVETLPETMGLTEHD